MKGERVDASVSAYHFSNRALADLDSIAAGDESSDLSRSMPRIDHGVIAVIGGAIADESSVSETDGVAGQRQDRDAV